MGVMERDRPGQKRVEPGSSAAIAAVGSAGDPPTRRRVRHGGAVRNEGDSGDR